MIKNESVFLILRSVFLILLILFFLLLRSFKWSMNLNLVLTEMEVAKRTEAAPNRCLEHPWRSVISIKLQSNITLLHGCSPVNSLHIFRPPFYKNTSGGLLLDKPSWYHFVIVGVLLYKCLYDTFSTFAKPTFCFLEIYSKFSDYSYPLLLFAR